MSPLGVLLAGGLSRRMGGGDKGLLPLAGKPVMAYALQRLQKQVDDVIINANGDPNRFAAFGLPIIPDSLSGFAGPLAGILTGLQYAQTMPEKPDFIITVASDTPFFPLDLKSRLIEKAKNSQTIVLASSNTRKHPTFGLWPVSLCEDLKDWLQNEENRKVLLWVERHNWKIANFDYNGNDLEDPFFNINTPQDLQKAEKLAMGILL